jgi:hypothetical protein
VAGTAKEYVSENYIKMLSNSIEKARTVLKEILLSFVDFPIDEIHNCINPISNIDCQNVVYPLNDNQTAMLIFANNREGIYPVSFNSNDSLLKIYDSKYRLIDSDIICNDDESSDSCSVYFEQEFSSKYIFNLVILVKTNFPNKVEPIKRVEDGLNLSKNRHFQVVFKQGNLSIYLPEYNQVYNITLSHSTYVGKAENQSSLIRPSDANPDGAYVFAPLNSYPDRDSLNLTKTMYWNGNSVKQIGLHFSDSRMLLRIFRCLDFTIEVESIFEPLSKNSSEIEEGLNKVLHIQSNIDNSIVIKNISLNHKVGGKNKFDTISVAQPEFWTDSNGMKMMRRYKDFRGGWEYYITDPVSANFYPVNYAISIREKHLFDYSINDYYGIRIDDPMITVFTERSQSGGAMKQGEIMLLMNRYSKSDDWKGLNENLYEKISLNNHFRMTNWVTFSSFFKKSQIHDLIHNRPTIFSFGLVTQFKNSEILSEVLGKNLNIKSYLEHLITTDSCNVLNYHILSAKEILVQVFNRNDPYFTKETRCKVHFKPSFLVDYTFEEINPSGTQKFNANIEITYTLKRNLGRTVSAWKGEIFVNPQDVRLFYLKFN